MGRSPRWRWRGGGKRGIKEGCVRRRYIKRQIHQIGEEHQNAAPSKLRYIIREEHQIQF
jgi:hypothetical protein